MLSDWPPETNIVLCLEMVHGCSDLMGQSEYMLLPSSLSRSPLCLRLYLFIVCFPFRSIALITCSLYQFTGLVFLHFLFDADSMWCFDLSYGTDKDTVCVCVCVLLHSFAHTHTHLCPVLLGIDGLPLFGIKWLLHGCSLRWTKTHQITYG